MTIEISAHAALSRTMQDGDTQPTSIWGDTDFKALVQKVEADAPHLFQPSIASEPQDTENLRPGPRAETVVSDNIEIGHDQQNGASSIEAEQSHPFQRDDLTIGAVPRREDASSDERAPKVVERRRKAKIRAWAAGAESVAGEPLASVQAEAPADDLDALDIENRRLKGLLASRLRQQNMQLRAMLERFGR